MLIGTSDQAVGATDLPGRHLGTQGRAFPVRPPIEACARRRGQGLRDASSFGRLD